MKIAVISYWSCPYTRLGVLSAGGMNVYLLNFAKYLGLSGHKVDIYTTSHKGFHETVIHGGNIRVIHLSHQDVKHKEAAVAFGQSVCEYIIKNSLQYDIAHAHYYYSGLSS